MSNETAIIPLEGGTMIGFGYMLFSVIAAVLYVPCLVVIRTDEELKGHSCLRVMFHLGICDMFMLATCFFGGLCSLMPSLVPYWYRISLNSIQGICKLNRYFISLTVVVGWFGYINIASVLALGRCLVFTNTYWEQKLFNPKATTYWLIAAWTYTGLWLVLHYTDWGGYYYYTSIACYHYKAGVHPWVDRLGQYNCVLSQTVICACSVISVWSIHKQAAATTSSNAQRLERQLIYQSLLICAILFATDQFWHTGVLIVCPVLGLYCFPFGTVFIILNASINSILYLTINKTVSKKVKQMVGIMDNTVSQM